MRPSSFILIVAISIAGCRGDERADVASSSTPSVEKIANCADVVEGSVLLASGVAVKCDEADAGFDATLRRGDETHRLHVERDATFHGFAALPGIAIVVDRYASNEDRLLILSLGETRERKRIIEHKWDDGDFDHARFEVLSADGSGIRVRELQYGGDQPPRERELTLSPSDRGWEASTTPWASITQGGVQH